MSSQDIILYVSVLIVLWYIYNTFIKNNTSSVSSTSLMKPGIYKNNHGSALIVQKVDIKDLTKYGVSQTFIDSLIKDKKTNTFIAGMVDIDEDTNKMCNYLTNKDDHSRWLRLLFNTGQDDNYSALLGLNINGEPMDYFIIDSSNNHIYLDSSKSILFGMHDLGRYFSAC
jgi:hypothetical protein